MFALATDRRPQWISFMDGRKEITGREGSADQAVGQREEVGWKGIGGGEMSPVKSKR
jgi:hypothetical protein